MNSFILKLLLVSLLFKMNRFINGIFFFEYMIFFNGMIVFSIEMKCLFFMERNNVQDALTE